MSSLASGDRFRVSDGVVPPIASNMDIPRPDRAKKKNQRRLIVGGLAGLALVVISIGVSQLRPAAPSVERSAVWIDTVKRGPMLRQVRGLGTLVPEDIQWIAARTEGRVEKIVARPGKIVSANDVLCILSNPELTQEANAADLDARSAEAKLASLRVQLEGQLLDRRAEHAKIDADLQQAKLRLSVNEQLSKNGLVAELELKLSRVLAADLQSRFDIDTQRLKFMEESLKPQLAVQEADVERLKAAATLKRGQVDALQVRAGMEGVLQALPLDVGQRVTVGLNLARVADPSRLKAEVRIAETQAKDIQIGQPAMVDTRNGTVAGEVVRVDPAVQNGTVKVDIALTGALPKGARPDLSVEGIIELERLDDVIFVGRPAYGQERGKVGLFKLSADGREAVRTSVDLGRSSVNTVEILAGLQPGDKVILSDMSTWDSHDRVRLN
jgi:HlyD family secretion protein